MAPAADIMKSALDGTDLGVPSVPVVANVTASPISDPQDIRRALVHQVTATVRWRESVTAMASDGVGRFVELGSGKVLTGLVKRIATGSRGAAFGQPADLDGIRALLEASS